MWETWVWSLGWEDPLEKGNATHHSNLAWRIPWTVVHGVTKSWTQLSNFYFPDFIFLLIKDLFSGWQFPLMSGHLTNFSSIWMLVTILIAYFLISSLIDDFSLVCLAIKSHTHTLNLVIASNYLFFSVTFIWQAKYQLLIVFLFLFFPHQNPCCMTKGNCLFPVVRYLEQRV